MKLEQLKIIQTLKERDPIELPMDEAFYNQLHSRVMKEVERTDVKQTTRWGKAWIFLESAARAQRANSRR